MSKNLTKAELIRTIAEAVLVPQKDVGAVLKALGITILDATNEGRTVLTEFGRFAPKIRAARTARNPRTGETVEVRERRIVSFKPGKSMS